MTPTDKTWIVRTGQIWKLYVALAGFSGTLLLVTIAVFSLATSGSRVVALTACGVFLGIATFLWLTMALRCPHCFARLVWKMVTSRPHSSWLIDLAGLDSCPVCHHKLAPSSSCTR